MSLLAALRLVGRLSPGRAPPLAPRALPVDGLACDAYEPPRRGRGTVVALHGVTLNGKEDPRLRAFAAAVAAGGTRCVVPTLPALADARWDGTDVDAVERVVAAAGEDGGPVRIVGFSHGGSLGLVAAARPATAPRVARVLAFGAYHTVQRALDTLAARPLPARAADWEDFLYPDLLNVHRHGARLGLPDALRADAADLLRRYCDAASLEEKRRFGEERLRPLGLLRSKWPPEPRDAAVAVSPAGNVDGLACPVDLVHDPRDPTVTVDEAHALLDDLRRARPLGRQRLLVTPLVSHVTPSAALRPLEGLTLLRMIGAMLDGVAPSP